MSDQLVLSCRGLGKEFHGVAALKSLDFSVEPGRLIGLLGPDGAGKTTLLRILTGLYKPSSGSVRVLGLDPVRQAPEIQSSIGYMPQKFGLYEDLTVRENMELYAELRAVPRAEQTKRFAELLQLTELARFETRPAGKLSGGMKQKLALACTLLARPRLILLDEPTVGVDVLSRRELWGILSRIRAEEGLAVVASTAYLDEADYCDGVLILYGGEKIAEGTPKEIAARAAGRVRELDIPPGLKARQVQKFLSSRNDTVHAAISGRRVRYVTAGAGGVSGWNERPAEPKFEDGFMYALRQHLESHGALPDIAEDPLPPEPAVRTEEAAPLVVKVEKLLKVFGSFTAVDNIDFEVRKGEVFGLLGANGAGKSTTFRMLCGLSRPDGGTLEVAGVNFRRAAAKMRRKLGYVAQKFSLYGDLSVRENMEFYGGAYGLTGNRLRERINWAETTFSLQAYRDTATAQIPGGFQRRLSMACALLHEPEIIFLDEPTSGADPLARREFWLRINELADSGVTVIITTHFLDEAEFCDRMVIMQDGRIPAAGTPEEIRRHGATADCPEPPLEEAFVEIIRKFRREQEAKGT